MSKVTSVVKKVCPHCGTDLKLTPNDDNGISALTSLEKRDNGSYSVKPASFIAVIPLVCNNCDYVELQLAD